MAQVSIIGAGTMGQAIAGVVAKGGHTAELLHHGDGEVPVTGEVVVLAVPYHAVPDVIAQRGAQLAGKVVVDITNPVNFETFDSLVVQDGSAAEEIAAELPESRVVKAFNTNFAATLTSGTVGEAPATVLIAGDDAEAKSLLAGIVTAGGAVRAVDAGSLRRARELEALGFLQITLAAAEKIEWTGGFTVS